MGGNGTMRSPQRLAQVARAIATEQRAFEHFCQAEASSDRAMLAAFADGWKDHEIAAETDLARQTVQKRRTRMRAKADLDA